MDDQVQRFVKSFRTFLDHVVSQAARDMESGREPLMPVLEAHLGVDPRTLPVVTERVSSLRFADADIALEVLAEQDDGRRLVGVGGGDQRRHLSMSEILQHDRSYHRFPVGPVDYARTPTGPESYRQVVSFGIHLLHHGGAPVAVLQRAAQPEYGRDHPTLEVLAPDDEAASALLDDLRRRAVLIAAETGRHQAADEDLSAALDELLTDAETLTRGLLGLAGTARPGVVTEPSAGWSPTPRPGLAPR